MSKSKKNNKVLNENALRNADGVLLRKALDTEEVVLNSDSAVEAPKRSTKTNDISALLLYDAGDERVSKIAPLYASQVCSATSKGCKNMKEFVQILSSYNKIGELYIYSHGGDGMITIGGESKELGELPKLFGTDIPTVTKKTELIGCNIGRMPTEVFKLGQFLLSPLTQAHTYWHTTEDIPFNKGQDPNYIRGKYVDYSKYFLPNTADEQSMVDQTRKSDVTIWMQWWSLDPVETDFHLPPKEQERRLCKIWSEARETIIVKSLKEAEELEPQLTSTLEFKIVHAIWTP